MASTRFHRLLEQKLNEEVANRTSSLVLGVIPDYATYRQLIGEIKALNDAIDLADAIERELDAR